MQLISLFSSEIRLEFNQTHLKYHTALDAILLVGYKPNSILQRELIKKGILGIGVQENNKKQPVINDLNNINDSIDYVSQLPVRNFANYAPRYNRFSVFSMKF